MIRVLYSFPHKLGAGRICETAWEQVNGLEASGAKVLVFPGVLHRQVSAGVLVQPTLSKGSLRISYKLVGTMRACKLHDYIVAHRLNALVGKIDIVHTWPLGALHTLQQAARLGIPAVVERPNCHTEFAYAEVQKECERLGVVLPRGAEHRFNEKALQHEEREYQAAYRILCPSEFVKKTFMDRGFERDRLIRHTYGFDPIRFYPGTTGRDTKKGLTMLFAGYCAVRKGVHFALEAWLQSPASKSGRFLIAGEFLPAYAERIRDLLSHPSVTVLGHRDDIPELMRESDIMVLPSVEEGFGLVCIEAMASGCVPLVSNVCTDICRHGENSLVHAVGDVHTLSHHITLLNHDRCLLERLRLACLATAPMVTWKAAGIRLLEAYTEIISSYSQQCTVTY